MKTVLILAGGFGSRLKQAVSNVPKPLAPVCGKPFLAYLVENFYSQGVREFIFLLHYEADKICSVLREMTEKVTLDRISITTIIESSPLGTGGSIKNAIESLGITDSFLVVNSDTWLGTGLTDLSLSPANSIAYVEVKDCSRYGKLVIKKGLVKRFLEKAESNSGGFINAGYYHLSPTIFDDFLLTDSFSLEQDLFPLLVDKGLLCGKHLETDFIDIGIPKDYFRFCQWIEEEKKFEL